jgi:hypothetical protein
MERQRGVVPGERGRIVDGRERFGKAVTSVDLAGDGNLGLAEDVSDLGFAEAGGVVFERELLLGFVEVETAKAVGVGEETEVAELSFGERLVQFVGDFDEGHVGQYSRPAPAERGGAAAPAFDKKLTAYRVWGYR